MISNTTQLIIFDSMIFSLFRKMLSYSQQIRRMPMENITKEQMEMARKANSKKEILSLAKEEGYDISDYEADKIFEYLNKHGELSEEELNDVTGGGCNDGGSTPKFTLNQTVYMMISGYSRKCHVTWVSSSKKKYGIIFKDNTWAYNIVCDEEPYVGLEKKDVPEYDLSNKSQEPVQPFTMA